MAGIAEALARAGILLHRGDYMDAALEALRYEEQVYSQKLGTWPDNRSWPAQTYMHGYCSGAPGIGIMAHRIRQVISGADISEHGCVPLLETAEKCAALAKDAVDTLPLMFRDHLCCGNSAVVEYYLSLGETEKAGMILGGMLQRKDRTGAFITMPEGYRNIPRLSLIYGIPGIGYELLRYAFPDIIIPFM